MPFDSNGTFNRVIPGGWKADAAANIKIRADRHDDEDDGFAQGLSTCITKDGRTQPVANIPMNQKRIINLGDPTADADAATKKYVDTFKSFTTGSIITGADANGRLTFSSPTGTNGIAWTAADLSWLAKLATAAGPGSPPVPEATINRLVLNNQADGLGTDVVEVREDGSMSAASLALSGALSAATFTTTGAATIGGSVAVTGDFSATGNVTAGANMQVAGSVFASTSGTIYLRPYGIGSATAQAIIDSSGTLGVTAGINAGGQINWNGYMQASTGVVIGAAGYNMHFRPYGTGNSTGEMYLDTGGTLNCMGGLNVPNNPVTCRGYRARSGINGGFGGNNFNFWWGGTYIDIYVDQTPFRLLSGISDYRIKRNVHPLASTWDKVKSLRPISYSFRDYGDLVKADTETHWGFIAHEVAEKLTPSAVIGAKDDEERIQQIDLYAVVTALTKALQEAMARIEALEAAA